MKKPLLLFFILSLFSVSAQCAQDADFREANSKYQAGDYKTAVSLYEKALLSGKPTAALYYNLGSAEFRSGDRGAALADYERAHALDPRDRDIEWNRSTLKSVLPDRISDSDDNVFVSSVQKLLEWVTVDEAALAFGLILAILFLVSALNFSFHRSKSLTAGLGGFFVLLLILSGAVFYGKWLTVKDPRVVVLEKEAAVRYGPSEKETKAFVLHEGALARVIDQTDEWYYLFLQDKNNGWILKKSCEIV